MQDKSNNRCLLYLFFLFVFCDLLRYNDFSYGVIAGSLSFIFDRPIIYKTVEYIEQSTNGSPRVNGLSRSKIDR